MNLSRHALKRALHAILFSSPVESIKDAVTPEPKYPRIRIYKKGEFAHNPKRQAKKATGLRGRQWVKFRKQLKRSGGSLS